VTPGQALALLFIVGLVVIMWCNRLIDQEKKTAASYLPLLPDLPPPPRIEDPTAPPVTYEDRAKWLPTHIRRDIERELARR
jgi:hypothetical protein